MEEKRFTPGPWHVSNEGKLIIRDDTWFSHVAWAGYATNNEEFAAARLIAAAPELLEALQACLPIWENHKLDASEASILLDCRAAIAKALGKE